MQIRVFGARCDGGTIAIGTGKDVDTGQDVSFAGESRPLRDVAQAVAEARNRRRPSRRRSREVAIAADSYRQRGRVEVAQLLPVPRVRHNLGRRMGLPV